MTAYNRDGFEENYWILKDEGKTDKEIAELMFLSHKTLARWKKDFGIVAKRVNTLGVRERDFSKADKIGVSRTLVLQRVRELGWSIEKAVNDCKNWEKGVSK